MHSQVDEATQAIQAALAPLADPAQAHGMQAYMLNRFAFLGIRAPARRAAVEALLKQKRGSDALLSLAEALWALPQREYHYTAVDLLAQHHAQLHTQDLSRLLAPGGQCHSWWDTVDGLAGVVGDVLLAARSADATIQRHADDWLLHPDMWVRRIALLHQLGWREKTDTQRLFRYALALGGEEFFIRKAIGWSLRNYATPTPPQCTLSCRSMRRSIRPDRARSGRTSTSNR